ncbi:MAG: DUF2585 family protein [Pyrinomonadaceae bacterium]
MPQLSESIGIFTIQSSRDYLPWIAVLAVVVTVTISLNLLGRVWWCQVGDYWPWAWDVWSAHNSQHVIDPYSFTHVLHGVIEFWLIGLVFPRLSLAWKFFVAILIEGTWEVAENTSYIINRYREETISLDYFGDSIINSLADIVSCGLGFVIAYKIRFWRSVILFVATEAILIIWIRDSLLINIVMLIYPLEAIKRWQIGG